MTMPKMLLLLLPLLLAALPAADAARRTSLDQAVAEARERYNGRVLSAQTRRDNGRESYQIRILTEDGRVRRLRIDAGPARERRPAQRPRRE